MEKRVDNSFYHFYSDTHSTKRAYRDKSWFFFRIEMVLIDDIALDFQYFCE